MTQNLGLCDVLVPQKKKKVRSAQEAWQGWPAMAVVSATESCSGNMCFFVCRALARGSRRHARPINCACPAAVTGNEAVQTNENIFSRGLVRGGEEPRLARIESEP